MKILLQSYESQNLKITKLEVKLRTHNLLHEKEMKELKNKYEERLNGKNLIELDKNRKKNKYSYIEEEEICQENVISINLVFKERE
jgi:hypothetical protein